MSYCENCGQFLKDDMANCPNCGSANPDYIAPVPAPDPEPAETIGYDGVVTEPAPAKKGTNVLAILGFVASLLPGFSGLISLILSIIGLVQIKKKDFEKPLKGLAIAGLILSILTIVFCLILVIVLIIAFTVGGLAGQLGEYINYYSNY